MDFVVLFIPVESALSSAPHDDRSLLEEATRRNVILATPATLVAILRLCAHGWRQEMFGGNVAVVRKDAELLYSRLGTCWSSV